MATPAQAAAATVGAGSLAAAGAYGITQAVNGSEESTTEEQTPETAINEPGNPTTFELTGNTNDLDAAYHGKILDITKRENLNLIVKPIDSSNQSWWEWSYTEKFLKKDSNLQLDEIFQKVQSGYSNTLNTALNKACDAAYKAAKTEFKGENKHIVSNISHFCTKGKTNPNLSEPRITVYGSEEITGYTNGLLSVESNKSKLIKTEVKTNETRNFNDLWWDWAFINIFSKETGSKSTDFNAVKKGYHASETDALNKVCDAGYKKAYADLKPNGSNPNLLADIKKFCSINKETTVLVLPEPATTTKVTDLSKYTVEKTLVKKNGNKDKLVNPQNNQDWWTWSYDVNFPKEGSPEKAKLPTLFSGVNTAYAAISDLGTNDSNPTSLNKACNAAYKKTKNEVEQKDSGKDNIFDWAKKLCSPTSLSSNLELPEA